VRVVPFRSLDSESRYESRKRHRVPKRWKAGFEAVIWHSSSARNQLGPTATFEDQPAAVPGKRWKVNTTID
jgi:hypothetical protein